MLSVKEVVDKDLEFNEDIGTRFGVDEGVYLTFGLTDKDRTFWLRTLISEEDFEITMPKETLESLISLLEEYHSRML